MKELNTVFSSILMNDLVYRELSTNSTKKTINLKWVQQAFRG